MTIIVITIMMIYVFLWRLYVLNFVSFKKLPKNLNSTLGFDHIYVISPLGQIERREKMKKIERALGLEFEFFLAYTPEISQSTLDNFYPHCKLSPHDKASFVNHYRVYESIARHGYDNALILEDDVDLEFNITSIMHNVHRILPENWDLLYLGFCSNWEGVFSEPLPDDNDSSVYKLFESEKPYCKHAYAVSSSGVFKLLRNLIPTTLPMDFELIKMIRSGHVTSYTIMPPPIVKLCTPNEGNNGYHYLKNSTVNLFTKKSKPYFWSLGFSHIYVINSSNRPGGREKLEAITKKLNLNVDFFFSDVYDQKDRHRFVYESISHHRYDSALIIDDGVDLELDIQFVMTDVHRILPIDWEILYLGHCSDLEGKSDNYLSVSSSYKLFKSKKPYCAHAYAVSYVGALKILQELSRSSEQPIDINLVQLIEKGALTSYTLMPPVVSQWSVSDNDKSSDKYPGKKTSDSFQLKESALHSIGLNSTLGFGQIYVINLQSRPDRREKFEKMANRLNLNFEIFPAVSMNDSEALNGIKADMGLPHKACYLSHYKVYQLIAQKGYDSALILEDDVDIELDVTSILTDAHYVLPSDWDLFYIGFCSNFEGDDEPLYNITSGYKIYRSIAPYCSHAYAVSRAGVLKFIEDLAKPTAPIDIALIQKIELGLYKSYTIVPPISLQWRSPRNPSDISPDGKVYDYYFLKNSALRSFGVINESNSTLGFNRIYVINHSYQTNNHEKLNTIVSKLFLHIEYITIYSGEKFDESNMRNYLRWRRNSNWMGHYKAYQSIIDNHYGSALILEVNVDFEVNIASIMSDVHRNLPADWDILYLGHCSNLEGKSNKLLIDSKSNSSDYKLFKSERPRCTHAYAVSNAGARKLLKKLGNPTLLPIGLELSNMIRLEEIISYTIVPPIVVQSRFDGKTSEFYTLKNSAMEFTGVTMQF
jgi:GR25 family glycosyltransferase involved in LPS biosynthesis